MTSVKSRAPTADSDDFTMVFTDVQGSTSLWEANPEAMQQALRLHDATIRQVLAKHEGYEVATEGDAFQLAFHDATDAVAFCLEVQTDLLECDWPRATLDHTDACASNDGAWKGLRVRMGVHSGRAAAVTQHEMTGRWRYAGQSVAMAKAVEGVCHGGQILVSAACFRQIDGLLTQLGSPQVVDLGEHIVQGQGLVEANSGEKGIATVRVLQLIPAVLAHDYFSCRSCASGGGSTGCLRGRLYPTIPSLKQTALGFNEAPSGPSITLCFAFTNGGKDLAASDPALAAASLGMLRCCVRNLLRSASKSGYECQEDEGDFMLAFAHMGDAAAFANALQRTLPQLAWPMELRTRSNAFARGLRMAVGALSGGYTSRGPHVSTGRADYFGTIVNRTARIAAAAHAGQVLLGGEAPLSNLTGTDMSAIVGSTLVRLGAFALKGVDGPMVIHELRSPGIDGQFEIFPEPKTKGRMAN